MSKCTYLFGYSKNWEGGGADDLMITLYGFEYIGDEMWVTIQQSKVIKCNVKEPHTETNNRQTDTDRE